MPVFFLPSRQIAKDTVSIHDPLFSHLRKSLRVKLDDTLWVGDEQRTRYLVRVVRISSDHLVADIFEKQTGPPPFGPRLVVGQAILKGDRMNWVVQKATELGMATLVPVISARTVIDPKPDRLPAYQARWQRIALEASQQSERWDVPRITLPCPAPNFWSQYGQASLCCILVERSRDAGLSALRFPQDSHAQIVLAIGPEGGWAEEELQMAQGNHFQPVGLGKGILRAETATIAAISLIQGLLGNLG